VRKRQQAGTHSIRFAKLVKRFWNRDRAGNVSPKRTRRHPTPSWKPLKRFMRFAGTFRTSLKRGVNENSLAVADERHWEYHIIHY